MEHEAHTHARNATEAALNDYKEGIGIFTQSMPEIAKRYNAFTEACFEDGQLAKKQKHLIALGIGLFAQDEYCIIYHAKGCLDHGCSEEEIMETAGVAAAFGGGAALSQAVTLLRQVLEDLNEENPITM